MRRSKLLVGGSMVAAVVLSASVAFAAPLSEKEWKQQGNAICDQVNTDGEAAANTAFAGLGDNEEPSEAQVQAFAEEFVPILKDAGLQINALDEPASLKKNVKKFQATLQVTLAKITDDPTVLLNDKSNPFAKLDKIALKLGLKTCANDS
jgi:hypothetical protein